MIVDIDEMGEGTLTKCKCGKEFFLSFEKGFQCEACKKNKSIKHIKEVLSDEGIQAITRKYSKRSKSNS